MTDSHGARFNFDTRAVQETFANFVIHSLRDDARVITRLPVATSITTSDAS